MSGIILHYATLLDFVTVRIDEHGPFTLISATKDGVLARRPRCAPTFFYWRDWFAMPAHSENSLQMLLAPGLAETQR